MTRPLARIEDGLPPAIDQVAARASESHRFLTAGWYHAAVTAYGGRPRTLLVDEALAIPLVRTGPRVAGLASVPGSYWPFRAPVAAADADAGTYAAAMAALAQQVRALRLGPVADGDPVVTPLIAAAREAGWWVGDRLIAAGWVLDLSGGEAWPRGSTLKKNRFHEKHLAAHGALDWRLLGPGDWPGAFDELAAIEDASWHGRERDRKFARSRHAVFWREAAADPAMAARLSGALLSVDGRLAAFSFDLELGSLTYAIANSYDPAFAKHSPGKLLQYRNLVAARGRGVMRVDWGMGDSGYKATIGAVEGPAMRDWLLLAPGAAAAMGRAIGGWWRWSGR